MKKNSLTVFVFAIAALLLVHVLPSSVRADNPTINITGPSGTVFVPAFPYNTTIDFTVSHSNLNLLNVLRVEIGGNQLYSFGNPFSTTACNNTGGGLGQIAQTCSVAAGVATIKVPWAVPGPGTYTIAVSTRHAGDLGEEEETATFLLLAVEYPAPPAVANAHLNATYPKSALSAKKRGCVISQIAGNHAHDSKYGPKGGPYDEDMIKADADSLLAGC